MVDIKISEFSKKIQEILEIIVNATKNQEKLQIFKLRFENILNLTNRLDVLLDQSQVSQQYIERLSITHALLAQIKVLIRKISSRPGQERIYGREDVQIYGEELIQAYERLGEVFHNIAFVVGEIEGEQSIENQRKIEEEQKQQFGRLQIELQQAQQKLYEFFEKIEKLTQEDAEKRSEELEELKQNLEYSL